MVAITIGAYVALFAFVKGESDKRYIEVESIIYSGQWLNSNAWIVIWYRIFKK